MYVRVRAAGIIPQGHLADGRMYLVLVEAGGHVGFLRFLIKLSSQGVPQCGVARCDQGFTTNPQQTPQQTPVVTRCDQGFLFRDGQSQPQSPSTHQGLCPAVFLGPR